MTKYFFPFILCILLAVSNRVSAQRLTVRTNLLSDAVLVPSVGAEAMLTEHWSLCVDGSWMPLRQGSEHYWRTWHVQPELRYWPVAGLAGPFVGGCWQLRGYNVGGLPFSHLKDSRSQGTMWGGGVTAGWHQILSTRWSLELSASLGYARLDYDHYDAPCSRTVSTTRHHGYFGPLNAGAHLIYIIK